MAPVSPADRAGSKDHGVGTSWCSSKSVLDVQVTSATTLPFEPPMSLYLDEVLLGLRGGEGDTGAAPSGAKPMFGLAQRWRSLQRIVHESAVAKNVCSALFWISMGAVFGRVLGTGLLVEFRSQFAEGWYSLMLQTRRHMKGDLPVDREARDWVVEAWPFIFAQVVYRVFFDAFKEDRENFSTQGATLLEKLVQIAHYEATGFKLDPETGLKARRRLFLRRVVKNPEQNQHDFLKGLSRQKAMESAKQSAGNLPMSFAQSPNDASSMQEAQLSDVWENRIKDEHQPVQRWDRPGLLKAALAKEEPQGVPRQSSQFSAELLSAQSKWAQKYVELSALRYEPLTEEGAEMFHRHEVELAERAGEEAQDAQCSDDDTTPDASPAAISPPVTPPLERGRVRRGTEAWGGPASRSVLRSQSVRNTVSTCSPASHPLGVSFQEHAHRKTVFGSFGASPNDGFGDQPNIGSDVDSSRLEASPQRWRKVKVLKTMTGVLTAKEQREKNDRERMNRQKVLSSKIAKEALPKDLSSKELVTTWVSPATQHLCPDSDDRLLLRKRSAEAFQLKMKVNQALARPLSMPNLRTATPSKEGSPTSTSGRSLASRCGSRGQVRLHALELDTPSAAGSPRSLPLSLSLPRVGSAKVQLRNGEEKVSLEGKPGHPSQGSQSTHNISSTKILQRMAEQSQALHKGTFGEYVKDYNILTGEPKRYRINKDDLRAEEDLTLRAAHSMVGGRAQRMTPLSKIIAAQAGANFADASCGR